MDSLTESTTTKEVVYKTYTNQTVMKALKIMARKIRLPFSKIYYPCSSTDVSVASVFKLRKVVHIDCDRFAVDCLRRAGYEAHCGHATDYGGYRLFELVVLMRSQLYESEIKKVLTKVVPGGYVFCEDGHLEATATKRNSSFEIQGIIQPDLENFELYWEDERLNSYWQNWSDELAYNALGNMNPGSSNFFVFKRV